MTERKELKIMKKELEEIIEEIIEQEKKGNTKMKNAYFLIRTDSERTCAEILAKYHRKDFAIADCKAKRKIQEAGNALRYSECSRERCRYNYYVTNTDEFIERDEYKNIFKKVPHEAIIF